MKRSAWNPANTILENFEDYEMKRNPTKVFRNLAPTSFAKPSEWKRKEQDNNKSSKKKSVKKHWLLLIKISKDS